MAALVPINDWPWQHWASLQPDSIALFTDAETYTWSALNQQISHLATYFSMQGLSRGQCVVLRGKNSIELLLCQLAIITCGAKVLPLNPRLPDSLLEQLLPHLDVNFVIDFTDNAKVFADYSGLDYQLYYHFIGDDVFQPINFHDAVNQPATLILTSGSTGLPKAAVHSICAHLNSADGVISAMNYQQDDCWLLSLPLFHVSGQGIVWRWLLRGGRIALRSQPLVETLQGVTHASLVPTQLWRLLNDPTSHEIKLKEVLLGGAMIPTSLTTLAASRGIVCWSGYGLTEMASTVCAKQADGKSGVGIPLKGKQVRLVDNEIQIQSTSQAMGYWFDGQIKPLNSIDGWFKTNDKGAFIDGEYQILGRLDNLFISGGECIQPEDIESIINSHPQVAQSFIIPIDDIEFGQRPVAVIDLLDNVELEIIACWLKDKLAPYQYPAYFYPLVDDLKSGGIKVSRQQVKNWVLEVVNLR
ncbi:o-succinylbenzoate--CoA ligase [Providencia heimbachae]|uniref:O-succinylbenzoic acid--CoA ligase n=1 Tax=Providencia heimbachae ATCC 35613 TaxID=1354272 RepID=A0A1B7JJW5_9GAMM|nr:o-succinylbenzoate--CoA ligase [Providencia heimbachae]OAT48220.1 O-succinylbenzoic acid--CoA ligase [Providencia heimbachae ATCC 35613]SQH12867.1 2-succinylbenzoate--CoA ligase [Providencia heimbachae]